MAGLCLDQRRKESDAEDGRVAKEKEGKGGLPGISKRAVSIDRGGHGEERAGAELGNFGAGVR